MKFYVWLILLFSPLLGLAQTPLKQLTISYEKLSTSNGKVMILVQDEKEQDVSKIMIPIYDQKASVTLYLPVGKYGVTAYHDVNGNQELDTNFLGVPNEPYGFSNNARGTISKPDYEDVIFELAEDLSITFDLK